MIIAIKQKDKTVVGYTNADYKLLSEQDLIHEENLPLKFAPNGNLFAFCKLGRVADYLLCDDEFLATEITPQNIVNKIIPAIKQAYKKMKQPITSSNNEARLVICNNEHLYLIGSDFVFYEEDNYGCFAGDTSLIRSVLDFESDMSAEEKIAEVAKAFKTIKQENILPLVITDTKTKQIKYLKQGEI